MIKGSYKKIFVLFFLWINNTAIAEITQQNYIEIKSKKLEYLQNQNKIFAEGNVEISSGTLKIKGDKLHSDIDKKYIIVDGSVTLNEGLYFITGDKCEYSFEQSTGYIYNARGYFEPWYFETEKVFKNKDIYILGKSKFSSCSNPKPHYVMSVSKAIIRPKEKIRVDNAVMYIGSIPIYYMPKASYPLKKRSDCWEIYPGYNSRDGISAKIKYSFPVTRHSYTKLHLDYYSEQNIGKGIEYNYNLSEKVKGTIYGYHIRDKKIDNERWIIKNSHWQKLTKTWSLQTNLNFLSDEYFNKYYFGENWDRRLTQINSSVGLTRQTRKDNLRISCERIDASTSTKKGFYLDRFSAPKIEWTLFQTESQGLPFYIGFNTVLSQNYESSRDYTDWTSLSDFYLTKQIGLTRRTILAPKIGIIESWKNKTDINNDRDIFLTYYYSRIGLRQRIDNYTRFEITHEFKNRTIPNSLQIDTSASDYGIEINKLGMSFSIFPKINKFLRISTGYDLKNYRTIKIEDNLSRFEPVTTEIKLSLIKGINCYIRHQQNVKPFYMTSINNEIDIILDKKTGVSFGIFHNYSPFNPLESIQIKNSLRFWLTEKWNFKISFLTDANRLNNKISYEIIDNDIYIYRDLHCWEAFLNYKKRGEIQEFYFNIGLKISKKAKDTLYDTELESEFYPWRGK